MPFPNEHAARQKPPSDFEPDSFRRKQIAPGVSLIMGKLKGGDGSMVVQSVRFDREKFTPEEAKAWLKRNKMQMTLEAASGSKGGKHSTAEEEPEYVVRSGKLFEAGDYPDKDFSLTEDEMATAAAEFEPVEVDLEHTPTVLSGKLGLVQSVEARGKELFGRVALPKWLADILGDDPLKVSCTWDRESKRLSQLALVLSPRISDAAVMSAFTEFVGKRHSQSDQADMQKIHDLAVQQGADCPMGTQKRGGMMSIFDRLKNLLKSDGASDEEAAELEAVFTAKPNPEVESLKSQVAAFEQQAKTEREARFAAAAEKFVFEHRDRIYPKEEEALVASLAQAARDDHATTAEVAFGDKKGSRVEALQAAISSRPEHHLREERVPAFVLPEKPKSRGDQAAFREEAKAIVVRTRTGKRG